MNGFQSCVHPLVDTTPNPLNVDVMALLQKSRTDPQSPLSDYMEAMVLANREADDRLGVHMLLSWYDRDRDFESPQHSSECHLDSSIPGYVDYGIHHGATLVINIHQGRFVFFYLPLDLG